LARRVVAASVYFTQITSVRWFTPTGPMAAARAGIETAQSMRKKRTILLFTVSSFSE
jgi:hypothetical protein